MKGSEVLAQKTLPHSAFDSTWEKCNEVIQHIVIAEDVVEVVVAMRAKLFAEYF